MNAKSRLRSVYLQMLLSGRTRRAARWLRESRRRLLGQPQVVSAFLQLDDPYSYLLSYYLPDLVKSYDIDLRVYLSEARGEAYQPAPDMLAEYASRDCERLARELGIPFLDRGANPPVEYRRPMLDTVAARYGESDFDEELLQALSLFWRGDVEAASRRLAGPEVQGMSARLISEARRLQHRLGHYNSATLHYAGEWYWGVDRLHYLLERLSALGTARQDAASRRLSSLQQAMRVTLPVAPPAAARRLPPLDLFHSFRSPYSYLSLSRTFEIADAFGLDLRVKPVLPMVMRGMKVPSRKLLYIVKDAAREAERRGIPFGKIADPVGTGAERCLAVFYHADAENRGRQFLLNAGEAIWSKAIDVATDKGMRKVTDKTGLSWPAVRAAIQSDQWRAATEANREAMMASGSWGVPTLRMGDFVAWGQDRDWLMVRHIEELCDSGDGILV